MLVLTRKPGEKVVIGEGIVLTVLSTGGRVRFGVEAPDDVPIVRGELSFFEEEQGLAAAEAARNRRGPRG